MCGMHCIDLDDGEGYAGQNSLGSRCLPPRHTLPVMYHSLVVCKVSHYQAYLGTACP